VLKLLSSYQVVKTMKKILFNQYLILLLLLGCHFSLATHSMWNSSATTDEPFFVGASRYIYETGNWDFHLVQIHPPLSLHLISLPLFFIDIDPAIWKTLEPLQQRDHRNYIFETLPGYSLLFQQPGDPMFILRWSRIPIIILSCILLTIIYTWGRALFNLGTAATIGLIYAISPNILTHARLATSDFCLVLFITSMAWALWQFSRTKNWLWFCGAAICTGGVMGSKTTGTVFPLVGICLLIYSSLILQRPRKLPFAQIGFFLLIVFLVLWGLYGFSIGIPRPANGHGNVINLVYEKFPAFLSHPIVTAVSDWRWPMPQYPRLVGSLLSYSNRGRMAYLMGMFSQHGWWYYFPIALLIKTPLPTLFLFFPGLVIGITNWRRRPELPYLLLPLLIILIMGLASSINIGLRHILSVFPFIFLFCGYSISVLFRQKYTIVVILLLAWLILGAYNIHPSHLGFFNELAGGPNGGTWWLSDSNVAWGEDFLRLARYQEEHQIGTIALAQFTPIPPETYGVKYHKLNGPTAGWIAVEIVAQQFARQQVPNRLAWLDSHKPVTRLGGIILYYIPE